MFTNTALDFPHGAMLTSAMLREIYKYPRDFFALLYQGYGDGIICGLDYFISDKNLILTSGVIRFDGEFYFLAQDLNISALAEKNNLETDKEYDICLSRLSEKKETCLTENNLIVTFSKAESFYKSESNSESTAKILPTLGHFCFSRLDPFVLPQLDKGVAPFKNIFTSSVLNLADVPFAERFTENKKDGATFHPLLFRLVKEFLAGKKYKTPFDYAILTQLQNTGVISIQTVKSYIANEGGKSNFTNRADLFKTFCKYIVESKFNPGVSRSKENVDNAGSKQPTIYTGRGKLW